MLKKQALFVVSALLPACLSNEVALAPQAGSVTLVRERDRPLHCKVLGKISGTSRSSDEKAARKGAENDLRNHAAELNGNFALAEAERGGPVGTSSQRDFFIGGKALSCETEAMAEAAEEKEKQSAKAKEQKEQEAQDLKQKEDDDKKQAAAEKKAQKKH